MAFNNLQSRPTAGFTLIELLAVTGIMVVITSVVLVNNGRFGGVIQLQNLAYDVALSIRQAQVYGISVARFGEDNFSTGYGVHFDTSNPDTYALFADALTVNGLYDCPNPGTDTCELMQTTNITRGFSIQDLCGTPPGGTTCDAKSNIDIVFIRPEPDAWISARINVSDPACIPNQGGTCYENAHIILKSPRGDIMSVVVEANGQISVQRGEQ